MAISRVINEGMILLSLTSNRIHCVYLAITVLFLISTLKIGRDKSL